MWEDYALNGADFDAGEEPEDPNVCQAQLSKEADSFGLWNPEDMARKLGFGDDDLVGEVLAEDKEDNFLGEIIEWFPYPSKMMFLLDTLDNLLRLRISNSLMRVFLWVLKEAKCKDVSSFDKLHRIQKKIAQMQGNVFFMNDPKAIIAKDWANPTTRKLIHLYPEIPEDGIICEIWHAQKWRKNMNLNILSPMYDAGATHYYVNEVSLLKTGNFVVPIRWVLFRGRVYADAFSIIFNDENKATIIDDKMTLICANDLVQNYFDLQQAGKVPRWSATTIETGQPARMPNPKRLIAQGDPLYSSFVDYFGDDVSGNRTKSWNKHWNAYMTHRNLPRKLLQQEFHVHFISASPNAGISEQFREFKASNQFKSKMKQATLHLSASMLMLDLRITPCRAKSQPILVEKVIISAANARWGGVPKHVKDLQTQTGIKDMYTQYWIDQLLLRFKEHKIMEPDRSDHDIQEELVQWTLDNRDKIYSAFLTMKGFDPTKDTPVEILHTILLGIVKYIWHISHTAWTPEQKSLPSECKTTPALAFEAAGESNGLGYALPPGMSHSPSQSDSSYSSVSSAGSTSTHSHSHSTSSASHSQSHSSHSDPRTYSTATSTSTSSSGGTKKKWWPLPSLPLGGIKGWTSDAGWGCVVRTGQSLLASTLGRVGGLHPLGWLIVNALHVVTRVRSGGDVDIGGCFGGLAGCGGWARTFVFFSLTISAALSLSGGGFWMSRASTPVLVRCAAPISSPADVLMVEAGVHWMMDAECVFVRGRSAPYVDIDVRSFSDASTAQALHAPSPPSFRGGLIPPRRWSQDVVSVLRCAPSTGGGSISAVGGVLVCEAVAHALWLFLRRTCADVLSIPAGRWRKSSASLDAVVCGGGVDIGSEDDFPRGCPLPRHDFCLAAI
ncbi:hypothetical protein B0H10DRAFT_1961890 [Mycena sp. CBHHK59/15]|nr:hypothetical protein B0H10DRAFT_1961890 [Mycena sp. CBHHK59/15]